MELEVIPEGGGSSESGVLKRESKERKRGRDILIAVNHSADSKHAFDWALAHLCRMADTVHLIHVLPGPPGQFGMCGVGGNGDEEEALLQAAEVHLDNLTKEAYDVGMVEAKVVLAHGDPGKEICAAAERIDAAALVMGSRGQSLVKSVLLGSVSEYCSHHCPCPIVIVPPKDHSVLTST